MLSIDSLAEITAALSTSLVGRLNFEFYARGFVAQPERYANAGTGNGQRWITIGAREDSGGERHGGFPVLIDSSGKIVGGGPRSLRGKQVSESGEHLRKMRSSEENARHKSPGPADDFSDLPDDSESDPARGDTWEGESKDTPARKPLSGRAGEAIRSAADDWELDPHELADAVEMMWGEKRDAINQREKAKQEARQRTGLTRGIINKWEDAGGDYATRKGFDDAARSIATDSPELGIGRGAEPNYAAELWDALKEGKVEPPPRHDAGLINDAAEWLASSKRAERQGLESVPFSMRAERSRELERYRRFVARRWERHRLARMFQAEFDRHAERERR